MHSRVVRVLTHVPRWVTVPVLVGQGLGVRRRTPRLPAATSPEGIIGDAPANRLVVVIGDSVAAGIGVGDHAETMAGQLADLLATRHGGGVAWRVVGQGGLTASGVHDLVDPAAVAEADLVVISVGVNDAKNYHGVARWRRELGELLDATLAAAPRADVVLLAIPPMEHFAALPAPLSWVLGGRARALDLAALEVLTTRPRIRRVCPEVPVSEDAFAPDGFHPGPRVHREWAAQVLVDSPSYATA